jgi:hypothetical protein
VSPLVAQPLLIVLTLLIGWAALWPIRHHLGATGYHLSAFVAGVIGWSFGAIVSSLTGRPLHAISALGGVVLFGATMRWIARLSLGDADVAQDRTVRWPTFAIAAGLAGGLSGLIALTRFTIASSDSYAGVWPMSIALARDGAITADTLATRGITTLAVSAGQIMLGGGWMYVFYPMVAAALLGWLALLIWEGSPAGTRARVKVPVIVAITVLSLIDPTFFYHSLYVHSHMLSALFLLVGVGAVHLAQGAESGVARSWLIVAGLATSGLVLTRPDGLAYAFVPVAVALAYLTASDAPRPLHVRAFYLALLVPVVATFGAGVVETGLWEHSKLGATTALAMIALLGATAFVPAIVRALRVRLRWLPSGTRLLPTLTGAALVLIGLAWLLGPEAFNVAAANGYANLIDDGGWGPFWFVVAGFMVASIASGDALGSRWRTRVLFLTIVLFFEIVALVHGTSHSGRLGAGDSLNRVMFHVVPLVLLYMGWVLARIGGGFGSATRTARHSKRRRTPAAEARPTPSGVSGSRARRARTPRARG